LVSTAGNTTKAKSAPYKGISLIEILVIFDIYPIKLNTTKHANNPHMIPKIGIIIIEIYLIF
jgi:hypothetical protein